MRGWLAALGAVALALGLPAAAPVHGTETPGCGPGLHTGYVAGRPYLVYVPAGAALPAPTIVTFHGRLQWAVSQITGTGLQNVADRHGVVLVAPQARGGKWDFSGSDTAFTGAVLDNVACDDPARTYAAGMSMGSAMTFLQACAEPRRFAAFGGVGFEIYLPNCRDPRPAPLIAFHGTADPIVPYAGGLTASTATAPPAEAAMGQWARHDGCRRYVHGVFVPGVTLRSWDRCRAGTQVQFYTLHGGRHVWPRTPRLDAGEIMWQFFARYRLRGA